MCVDWYYHVHLTPLLFASDSFAFLCFWSKFQFANCTNVFIFRINKSRNSQTTNLYKREKMKFLLSFF